MNLHGPVRVASAANPGKATVTISLDGWKDGRVGPTTLAIAVAAPKAGAKSEPVSPRYVRSLIHPERKASVPNVAFSPDGAKLLTSGYPSGIVQIWDPATGKELRRVETPRGSRGSPNYAHVSADWSTLYVTAGKQNAIKFERDGKRMFRVECEGEIRVWDLTTGKQKPPLKSATKNNLLDVRVTPDGGHLITTERLPYESGEDDRAVSNAIDLRTGRARKLADGYGHPTFAPDGKTVALAVAKIRPNVGQIRLLDAATWKELARWDAPADRTCYGLVFSPDGKWLVVPESGEKGQILSLHVLNAATLTPAFALPSPLGKEGFSGFSRLRFTPDSESLLASDATGKINVIDVRANRIASSFALPDQFRTWFMDLSPDGRTLAVNGQPVVENGPPVDDDSLPEDLPQPRVFLFDLKSGKRVEEIVCPHSFWGGLAFSPDGKTLAVGGTGAVHLFDMTKVLSK